jgi:signal transduction histidine kinase
MDFSQLLAARINNILDKWVLAVRQDKQINSVDYLSYRAIKDHIPDVLKAMVTVLSTSQNNDFKSIVTASWQHGSIRAVQGFDPEEIAREYHQLRIVIFDTIQPDLLQGTPLEIIRTIGLINSVIDEAIAQCFHSYVAQRLIEIQNIHSALILHNQELTRLINANQDNLSRLAHDLKHPLASIIGYSDLFLRQHRKQSSITDTQIKFEHIERVLHNGRYLLHLINNLLEMSRHDTGKIQIELAPTNVCEIINWVYQMFEPLAAEKNLLVSIDCQNAPPQVMTDSFHFQQIIINLISNAIRYTPSGTINIICRLLDEQTWQFVVADSGIGISPETQQHIFEPYFRVNSGVQLNIADSTGLGLAIVSHLVKLLQGEIEVVSQLGVGSTFTVTFPVKVESK